MTELSSTDQGAGKPVLLIHETATTGAVFGPLVERSAGRARMISYDRWGWGGSVGPGPVLGTSISEQARDASGLLRELGAEGALACGVGCGAVIALELALSRPDLIEGVVMVEPPLLGLLPQATTGFSADAERITEAIEADGTPAAYELYLSGGLPTIGPGADRIAAFADRSAGAPRSFVAELAAVPAWPIDPKRLAACEPPVTIVTSAGGPELLSEAADRFAPRLEGAVRVELPGAGPAQLDAADELASRLAA